MRLTNEDTGRAKADYAPEARRIAISDRLSGDQRTKTLAHAAAHYLAAHRGRIDRGDAETVAASAAFVVISHFGIDSGSYRVPYVAQWAQAKDVFKRNLGEIQGVARGLMGAIAGAEPPHRE